MAARKKKAETEIPAEATAVIETAIAKEAAAELAGGNRNGNYGDGRNSRDGSGAGGGA